MLPHDPEAVPVLPSVKVPAACVPDWRLTIEPEVIQKLLVIVIAVFKVTPAALLIVRLLTEEGSPFPVT